MTRHIAFDAIDNFRDFGDYAAGARRLKRGLLYRAANQAMATEADLEKLAGLNLSVIVDLRRANERERSPSRRWDGFAAEVIENDIGQDSADEWSTFIADSDLSVGSFHAYMMDYYRQAPFQRRHIDLYQRYFRALAATEGPILVHCAAGKDRTGLACAYLHHIAGVHHDDMIADYLLTNDDARLERKAMAAGAFVEELLGRRPSDEALLAWVRVFPEYLAAAFDEIAGRCGSMDRYLEDVLGVDARLREAIHDRVLG